MENNNYYYWKPKEPLLVYDYPLEPVSFSGLSTEELLDEILSRDVHRPDAYGVVAEAVMKIVQEHLGYLGDILIGLRVGDYDTIIRGQLDHEDEPYYYVAETDWWEGEGEIRINYIVLEDYLDELMEGVEPNA